MIPTHRRPTLPGEILLEEFLKPLAITPANLAARLGVKVRRVNNLINGKRAVTPEMAILLGREFKTTPEFWMNAQSSVDLYDRSKASRGKLTMGTPVRRLDDDLAVVFPNSEAVNGALRTLVALGSAAADLRPMLTRLACRKLKAMQAELRRLAVLADTDRYLAELAAEVGPPTRADLARADAIVRGIKGRGRRNGGSRS